MGYNTEDNHHISMQDIYRKQAEADGFLGREGKQLPKSMQEEDNLYGPADEPEEPYNPDYDQPVQDCLCASCKAYFTAHPEEVGGVVDDNPSLTDDADEIPF